MDCLNQWMEDYIVRQLPEGLCGMACTDNTLRIAAFDRFGELQELYCGHACPVAKLQESGLILRAIAQQPRALHCAVRRAIPCTFSELAGVQYLGFNLYIQLRPHNAVTLCRSLSQPALQGSLTLRTAYEQLMQPHMESLFRSLAEYRCAEHTPDYGEWQRIFPALLREARPEMVDIARRSGLMLISDVRLGGISQPVVAV